MIKIKHLFLSALVLASFLANAQNIGGAVANVEAANSANADKGGSGGSVVSVDYYTGTASVNVPIYDYSVDGLYLGVSLSYAAKGIRVDELASPVGLGWYLNGPPEITRQVNGLEDEVTLRAYFYNSYVSTVKDSIQGILVPGANPSSFIHVGAFDDTEHDIFNVNIGGRSISFVMMPDGTIRTYPRCDIKVEVFTKDINIVTGSYYNSRPGIQKGMGQHAWTNVLSFVITDEKNNKFYFERGDYTSKEHKYTDFTDLQNGSSFYNASTRWVAHRIVTGSGLEIKYNYTSKFLSYLENVFEVINTKPAVIDGLTNTVLYDPVEINKEITEGHKSHVTSIEYPSGTVVSFDLGSGAYDRCDCQGNYIVRNITIAQKFTDSVETSMRFKFNYSFLKTPKYTATKEAPYTTNCTNLTNYNISDSLKALYLERGVRLCLRSIDKYGADNVSKYPYYSFGYDTSFALPYRFSPHKDYYGFYNGATCTPYTRQNLLNSNLTDTFYLSIPNHWTHPGWGVDRSHSSTYAQACVLNKITNTHSGETILQYQSYNLQNKDSAYGNFIGWYDIDTALEGQTVNDGLCIWKVSDNDPYQFYNSRVVEYYFNGGQRFNRGGYTHYFDGNSNRIYTNNFIAPIDYVNGSNHGFSEVTVRGYDFAGLQLTKQTNFYSNLMYWEGGNYLSCLHRAWGDAYRNLPGDMRKFRLGVLLKTEMYDRNNYLFSKTENTYEESIFAAQTDNRRITPFNYGSVGWTFRVFDREMFLLKNTKITRYLAGQQGNKSIETNYSYEYDNKFNVKSVTWVNSKGEELKKVYKYNYDYFSAYPSNSALSYLNDSNYVYKLSDEVWKIGSSDSFLLSLTLSAPQITGSGLRFPSGYALLASQPIPSATANSSNFVNRGSALLNQATAGTNFIRSNYVTAFDGFGNVGEKYVTDKDVYNAFVYDARNSLIAEVQNAKGQDIAYTSFEGKYTGMPNPGEGNWYYDPSAIVYKSNMSATPITGCYAFSLTSSNEILFNPGLTNYFLSFWVMSTDSPVVELWHPGGLPNSSWTENIPIEKKNQVGQWKLYTASFGGDLGGELRLLNPNNTSMRIDELRAHPHNALMTSYTYKPLFGIGSVNSPTNYIRYYEFDTYGNRAIHRDMRGFILEKKEMGIRHDDTPNNGNSGSSGGGSEND